MPARRATRAPALAAGGFLLVSASMFRNLWASLDEACAASSDVVAAAPATYQCRAVSCVETLGGDEVCTAEDAAFRQAEEAYGACLAGSG